VRIEKKIKVAEIDTNETELSKVALLVLDKLETINKPIKVDELVKKSGLSIRTIRYGLKLLLKSKKITKIPDLSDLRSYYYKVKQ
jgi:hypothetical protein